MLVVRAKQMATSYCQLSMADFGHTTSARSTVPASFALEARRALRGSCLPRDTEVRAVLELEQLPEVPSLVGGHGGVPGSAERGGFRRRHLGSCQSGCDQLRV